MLGGMIQFQNMPTVGFAHHFYTEKAHEVRYGFQKSVEIAYIKSGEMTGQLWDYTFQVPENSFLVLFRHLPIRLFTTGEKPHAHCSLQLQMDYEFQILEKATDYHAKTPGLLLPFLMPGCQETEAMKKLLYGAVSDLGISRQEHGFCAALAGLSILQMLSGIYRKQIRVAQSSASLLQYRIKEYIAANIDRPLNLEEIAAQVDKTPNHVNHVFREECGVSIHRYINEARVRRISDLMQTQAMSFAQACESVGIADICYGYRLFRKHMGITPREYMLGKQYLPEDRSRG